MALEIERKFLVKDRSWQADAGSSTLIRQGYIPTDNVAVRVRRAGDEGFLTIKCDRETGLVRDEFEYQIPVADAEQMLLSVCMGGVIDKVRWDVVYAGSHWVVDEFKGHNDGLMLAELELASPDEKFVMPPWAGEEVTNDLRYRNVVLAKPKGVE